MTLEEALLFSINKSCCGGLFLIHLCITHKRKGAWWRREEALDLAASRRMKQQDKGTVLGLVQGSECWKRG